MRLIDISIGNLRRRKSRLLFSVLGLAIGIATMVILYSITSAMKEAVARQLDEYGANIVVVPRSEGMTLSYGGITVAGVSYDVKQLDMSAVTAIRQIKDRENISAVAPKLLGAVSAGGRQAVLVGVDFTAELRMKKWWEITGQRPGDPSDLLLGHGVAAEFRKAPGDLLVINGHKFRVAGVLKEIGSQEDGLIFGDLGVAQKMLGQPGKLSLIEVSALCLSCPVDEIVRQIAAGLPDVKVTALRQAVKGRLDTVERLDSFSYAVSIVVLLIGVLMMATTMLSSVNERTREIGIFRAIGFRKSHVMVIILFEALVISLLGGLTGYAAGILGARAMAPYFAKTTVAIAWSPLVGVISVALAVVAGILASLYPAWRASRLDPAEALRFI